MSHLESKQINNLDLPFEIKEVSEEGTFEGLASVYGVVDLGGDLVERGAFARTIKARPEVTILWRHDSPIGKGVIQDSEKGLLIRGRLTLGVAQAKEALALMRDGVVRGLSIGFTTIQEKTIDGIRHLRELRLWEVSLTPFPMNQQAMVESVKQVATNGEGKDFDQELDRVETGSGHYMKMQALSEALYACMYMEGDAAAKVAEAAKCIDQFKASYVEWFPRYLAMREQMYGKESKEGRVMSAATRAKIESLMADQRAAMEKLQALLDEGVPEEEEKAAPELANRSEDPVVDHSALSSLIAQVKETYVWN